MVVIYREPFNEAAVADMIVGATMLGRAATFDDIGNVAAFAASVISITCGAIVG